MQRRTDKTKKVLLHLNEELYQLAKATAKEDHKLAFNRLVEKLLKKWLMGF